MLGKTQRIHFVGIGGIGMSGIAELLRNLGYDVSGSDAKTSDLVHRLAGLGVRIHEGHDAAHVRDADVLVVSSAIAPDNPEVQEAHRRRIPVIPRAEMLAELMRLRYGIAVGGAHGKTTTTSMIALVLERAGLDPTAVIGGRLSAFGSNARLGAGDYMVVEADESDRSFLRLSPAIAVVTNIDREHLESYGGFDDLLQAFLEFAGKVPFYGAVVACLDDPYVAGLIPRISRRVITYGLSPAADVRAEEVTLLAGGSRCRVAHRPAGGEPRALGGLTLNVPGRHCLLNALAATAVGLELGLPFEAIAAGLAEFRGAERRFEIHGPVEGVTIVDDYGHHPTEIRAVLDAARLYRPERLVVAFQPHRYSRTAALLEEFGPALREADEVILTGIYAAGERARPGVTIEALVEAVRTGSGRPVRLVKPLEELAPTLATMARPGDMIILLGAGSIGGVAGELVRLLATAPGQATH